MTSVSEAIETYLFATASLSQNTLISYRDKLAVFQTFCEANDISLGQITPKVFRGFLDHVATRVNPQTGRAIGVQTLASYGRVLKVFLTWVSTYEDYLGAVKPGSLKAMRVPRLEKKVKPIYTPDEIRKLYEATRQEHTRFLVDRDKAIITMLTDSGVRASELCALRIGDVHLDIEDTYVKVMGKGNKEREVGLGRQARLDLHRYLTRHRKRALPTEPVFLSRLRTPLTRNGLDQMLYRLKEWAGIKKEGGAHMFRHTYATMYLDQGGDIYDLRDLMGHEHVSTTEVYTRGTRKKRGKSVWDQGV